jgi:hypothetical protein
MVRRVRKQPTLEPIFEPLIKPHYVVPPLEGLWWGDDPRRFITREKEAILRQPLKFMQVARRITVFA